MSMSIPVSALIKLQVEILDQFQTVIEAISSMQKHSIRCILVSNTKKEIIGLVSKTDILYQVVSLQKNPTKVPLIEIMSVPIISIPPEMSIRDALKVMEKHNIRQVVVTSGSNIYGIVDREDIIVKMERAVLESAHAFSIDSPLCIMDPFASTSIGKEKSILVCPHCQTEYSNKELLSKHVKTIHPRTNK
jgi:signal-transduction protein with cAMP-binding, CBS, and nucleotidyltransferase domain